MRFLNQSVGLSNQRRAPVIEICVIFIIVGIAEYLTSKDASDLQLLLVLFVLFGWLEKQFSHLSEKGFKWDGWMEVRLNHPDIETALLRRVFCTAIPPSPGMHVDGFLTKAVEMDGDDGSVSVRFKERSIDNQQLAVLANRGWQSNDKDVSELMRQQQKRYS